MGFMKLKEGGPWPASCATNALRCKYLLGVELPTPYEAYTRTR